MRKYRVLETEEDWCRLEYRTRFWPFWKHEMSGTKAKVVQMFNSLTGPPLMESGWVK